MKGENTKDIEIKDEERFMRFDRFALHSLVHHVWKTDYEPVGAKYREAREDERLLDPRTKLPLPESTFNRYCQTPPNMAGRQKSLANLNRRGRLPTRNAGDDRSRSTFIPYPTFVRFCRIPEDEEIPEVLHGNVEAETDDTSDTAFMETDNEESTIGDNDSIQAGVSSQQLIRMAVSGQQSPPSAKRQRTDQYQPKLLTVQLSQEYTTCSICQSKYSTDINNKDDNIRKHLPVISASSKSCDHYFCHGCILKQQASIAEENDGKIPKWIPCMTCRTMTAFCPSEPKYHRMLIDILKQARWTDMAQVKEEESTSRCQSEMK